MTTRTLTAMFDARDDAERVRTQLLQLGARSDSIQIVDRRHGRGLSSDGDHKGFWESVKDFFVPDEDQSTYTEGLRRGGYLLTGSVDDSNADEAIRLIEASNAIDLDTRSKDWQAQGWSGGQYTAAGVAETNASSNRLDSSEESIPVVEERLRVGKREVNRGGVRVRSYIIEEPVHEDVSLREEHVEVERRPARGQATAAGDLFRERVIEATETAEEAVVAKDAVVTEEVVVKKFTGERTQGIDETVRRTDVDVDDMRSADDVGLDADVPVAPARKSRPQRSSSRPRK